MLALDRISSSPHNGSTPGLSPFRLSLSPLPTLARQSMPLFAVVLAFFLSFWGPFANANVEPDGTKRVALVIGNSEYENDPLKNPANDAADMAATHRCLQQ